MKRQEKIAAILTSIDQEEQDNSLKKDKGEEKKAFDEKSKVIEDIENKNEDENIEDIEEDIEASRFRQQISEKDTTIKQLQELVSQQSQEQQRLRDQIQIQEQQTKILQSQIGKILEFLQNQSKMQSQNQVQSVKSAQNLHAQPAQQTETQPNTGFDFKTLLTPEVVSALVMRLLSPPNSQVASSTSTEMALSDMSKIFLEGGKMANSSLSQAIELVKALKE